MKANSRREVRFGVLLYFTGITEIKLYSDFMVFIAEFSTLNLISTLFYLRSYAIIACLSYFWKKKSN